MLDLNAWYYDDEDKHSLYKISKKKIPKEERPYSSSKGLLMLTPVVLLLIIPPIVMTLLTIFWKELDSVDFILNLFTGETIVSIMSIMYLVCIMDSKNLNTLFRNVSKRFKPSSYKKYILNEITDMLNQVIIINDKKVTRLWKYLDISQSSDKRLVFSFEDENDFGFVDVKSLNGGYKDKKLESEAILYEAQTVEKISKDTVINISNILIDKEIKKKQEIYQDKADDAFEKFEANTDEQPTTLEQSLKKVSENLKSK